MTGQNTRAIRATVHFLRAAFSILGFLRWHLYNVICACYTLFLRRILSTICIHYQSRIREQSDHRGPHNKMRFFALGGRRSTYTSRAIRTSPRLFLRRKGPHILLEVMSGRREPYPPRFRQGSGSHFSHFVISGIILMSPTSPGHCLDGPGHFLDGPGHFLGGPGHCPGCPGFFVK